MVTCGARTDYFSHIEIILETESAVKINRTFFIFAYNAISSIERPKLGKKTCKK